ncbi:hypothetical protein ACFQGX_48140 [Nonomuraea dietziae]|uniref:hypothetical protein n=1 Tax=Nonomuraea dietziae TaxID=65515 RepID=UPI00360C7A0F
MDLFPYVVDDVEWARENGYGRTRRQELGKTAAPSEKYFRALPEDRRRAWLTTFHGDRAAALEAELPIGGTVGHSANGCAAQAWQELYGDKGRWFKASRVIQTLGNMRIGQTQADPAYRGRAETLVGVHEPNGILRRHSARPPQTAPRPAGSRRGEQ